MPKPAPVAPSKKRKRLMEEVPELSSPKPLLSGAVPLEAFLASLHKVGELDMGQINVCTLRAG